MATIETVTGPIDAGDLGTTLIHEHLVARDEAVHAQFPRAGTFGGIPERPIEPGNEYEAAVEAAGAAVDLGVESICDPTAMFLGRDVDFMRRVSEQTGLKVVACTGIYTYDHLPSFFVSRDPDQIAELFIADIEQGVQDSEIKAAFIKCAADEPGITENVEKLHRAAARTSLQTGAPIMAHSRPAGDTGPKQVEIFESEGVNPAKVQIAHTGDTDDLDYIERLLDRGVYIGMDRYGLEMFLPVTQRDPTVLALLERGHAERMFLAADSCATLDWFPANVIEQLVAAGAAKDWDIRNVPAHALPRLRAAGMTAEQERTMMVENPVRWLTGESV